MKVTVKAVERLDEIENPGKDLKEIIEKVGVKLLKTHIQKFI